MPAGCTARRVQKGSGNARRQPGRNLGETRCRHGRLLHADRANGYPVPADPGEYHRRRPDATDRDPITLDADRRRRTFGRRTRGLLRSAQRDHRGGRHAPSGASLNCRPPPRRTVRHATDRRSSRCACPTECNPEPACPRPVTTVPRLTRASRPVEKRAARRNTMFRSNKRLPNRLFGRPCGNLLSRGRR